MPRRGYTLIEMLVVLTVGSAMLGIGIGMLHLLMRAEQSGRDRVHRSGAAMRLAEQFRADAAAAEGAVSTNDTPTQCGFLLASGRIASYRIESGEARRDEWVMKKLVRTESYPISESGAVIADYDAKPPTAKLTFTDGNGRQRIFVAPLGKDCRFTNLTIGKVE
jgi:prepilin-type N-terminal cleavage/methylation domain-containing protein